MRPLPLNLLIFIFLLGFLLAFIQLGLLTIAFDKLGLSQSSAFTLLFISLMGSMINLPITRIQAEAPPVEIAAQIKPLWRFPRLKFTGTTLIALNVGGGLIPILFSFYLLQQHEITLLQVMMAIIIVSAISYLVSRPIHGLGIGMPMFIAPLTAALTALLLNPEQSAPLAYICGTMGVLIGADLFRLKDIRHMGTPIAAIGGAGTFDGIFITGIVAVLLA